jgi:KTSC domain
MQHQRLSGGKLRSAGYDANGKTLEIAFVDGSQKTFSNVPLEVFRRLLAAPNPASFYEDRIEEEYPVKTGRQGVSPDARSKLDDLFG